MNDTIAMTATKARERYERDARFHGVTRQIVAHVLREHGPVDPDHADREAHDIATAVAAMVHERMFAEDQELAAQRAIAERYKKIAEDALASSPLAPRFLFQGAPLDNP